MKGKILALCDREEEYAQLMTEFLKGHKDIPFAIYTYSDVSKLVEFANKEEIEVLLVAESAFSESVYELPARQKIILNESGVVKWEAIKNIDKYQQAEDVYKEILCSYMEVAEDQLPKLKVVSGTKVIGMYSPIRRCLQTSFALTLGQTLAKEHKTLYLNFEHYGAVSELLPNVQNRDLSDLLYFLTAQPDKFRLWMNTILMKKGDMDYLPPMKIGEHLLDVSLEEWRKLIQYLSELGEYEYLILDLSESIRGLVDILSDCHQIFTMISDDAAAKSKLMQYEQVLALCEKQEILERTHKHKLPYFKRLPNQMEYYTKGDLADYVRKVIVEELN
ncbi:hypothetical protein LJC58_03000 [Lachnospiraceae bacterium OttesenSCG-928-D06]|nr:hypothetical protein [Lachnospiraceae bacterium OttesenSCG-928-D06]